MVFPLPHDESHRLRALHDSELLVSGPDQGLDRLVEIVRGVFDVPMAAVSLLDHDRQYFKARAGVDLAHTDRAVAFCNYTILGDGVCEVRDATLDSRFDGNWLVHSQIGIRYYAGFPIRINDRRIGALCLMDRKQRQPMDPGQSRLLQHMAEQAEHLFTVREQLRGALRALSDGYQRAFEPRVRCLYESSGVADCRCYWVKERCIWT